MDCFEDPKVVCELSNESIPLIAIVLGLESNRPIKALEPLSRDASIGKDPPVGLVMKSKRSESDA
jgi:hypothetical protein